MDEVLDAFVVDITPFNQGDLDAIAPKVVSSEISQDGLWLKFSVSMSYPCAREVVDMLAARHPNLSRKYGEGSEVFNADRMVSRESIGLADVQEFRFSEEGTGSEEE